MTSVEGAEWVEGTEGTEPEEIIVRQPKHSSCVVVLRICIANIIIAVVLVGCVVGNYHMSVATAKNSVPGTVLWQIPAALAIPFGLALFATYLRRAYPPEGEPRGSHVRVYDGLWYMGLCFGTTTSIALGISGSVNAVQLQTCQASLHPVLVDPFHNTSALVWNLTRQGATLVVDPGLLDDQTEYGDGGSNDGQWHRVYRLGNFTTVVVTYPVYEARAGLTWLAQVDPGLQSSVNRAVIDLRYRFPNTTLETGALGLTGSRQAIQCDEAKQRVEDIQMWAYITSSLCGGIPLWVSVAYTLTHK